MNSEWPPVVNKFSHFCWKYIQYQDWLLILFGNSLKQEWQINIGYNAILCNNPIRCSLDSGHSNQNSALGDLRAFWKEKQLLQYNSLSFNTWHLEREVPQLFKHSIRSLKTSTWTSADGTVFLAIFVAPLDLTISYLTQGLLFMFEKKTAAFHSSMKNNSFRTNIIIQYQKTHTKVT